MDLLSVRHRVSDDAVGISSGLCNQSQHRIPKTSGASSRCIIWCSMSSPRNCTDCVGYLVCSPSLFSLCSLSRTHTHLLTHTHSNNRYSDVSGGTKFPDHPSLPYLIISVLAFLSLVLVLLSPVNWKAYYVDDEGNASFNDDSTRNSLREGLLENVSDITQREEGENV